MRLSWSHKLFFQVNQQIGKRKWLDVFMLVCARWLIYILGVVVLSWGQTFLPADLFKVYIKLLLSAVTFAVIASWTLALIWPHRRPVIEFPGIKQLFKPMETWKSFPSDHTLISFSFVFVTFLLGASWWFSSILFVLALLVGFARIYSGVHYPRDIVGGTGFALFFSLISYWLVVYITQPLYNFLIKLF